MNPVLSSGIVSMSLAGVLAVPGFGGDHLPGLKTNVAQGLRALVGAWRSSTSETREPAPREEWLRPVRWQPVQLTGSHKARTFSGTTKAGLEASLSFKISGTIARLHVEVGDRIAPGYLIAEMDHKDYELQVQRAGASLARERAQATKAAAVYRRIKALYTKRYASQNDLDAARAAAESSLADVHSRTKELELDRRQLQYTRLVAPETCSVAEVRAEVNENVQPGTPVVDVVCGSKLEVEVAVPEAFIARIHRDDRATVTLNAFPGTSYPATVTKVGVVSSRMATTFPVTVLLQREIPEFRSGLAAEVTLSLGPQREGSRMVVPPIAVRQDRDGRFVFLVEEAGAGFGIVHRTPVKVGELTPEGLEILEGLVDGQRVVTAGVRRLQDGREVKFMDR